jgi:hypothetical protein
VLIGLVQYSEELWMKLATSELVFYRNIPFSPNKHFYFLHEQQLTISYTYILNATFRFIQGT